MNSIHIISVILAISCVFIIFLIGIKTDLLKESNESGKAYSFSRFQLWLWTITISPAFVLNWGFYALSDPYLNTTCLILLGIPASIAITGRIITSVHESQREQVIANAIESQKVKAGNMEQDIMSIIKSDPQVQREQAIANTLEFQKQKAVIIKQDIVQKMQLKSDLTGTSFWTDILKDDNGQLSIGRLQQFIFTLIYVVIFLTSFFASNMKEYPDFHENAFTLMGISAGTYLIGKGLKK